MLDGGSITGDIWMQESQNTSRAAELSSRNRETTIRKVTWVGLVANVLLAGFKFLAGIIGSSQALVADAIHSLTDLTTDIAVIAGSHYWSRPPDESHPYGHRRMETLVTVFIGVVLAAAGIGVGWKAISTLHMKHAAIPGWIAVLAALIAIICKEVIYRWTAMIGRKVKSSALADLKNPPMSDPINGVPDRPIFRNMGI